MNKTLLLSAFALLACTNDYDLLKPGGGVGGAGTGAGTTSNMGGSTTSNTGGSTTSNMGGSTTSNMGGSTTSSMGGAPTTTTTTTTNTTATTTTGTGGMGGGPVTVPCGTGGECDVSGGEFCCVAQTGSADGTCAGMCNNGNQADLSCNEPSDCPGEFCCINLQGDFDPNGDIISAQCRSINDCISGPHGLVACDLGNDQCPNNFTCTAWDGTTLPAGFTYCKPN